MAISRAVNLSRYLRQVMYLPSTRRSVSLLILRAILNRLTPASLPICRKVLPFSQYIVIKSLSSPLKILNLCRIRSTLSRDSLSSFSPASDKLALDIFINNPDSFLSSGIGLISHPFSSFSFLSRAVFRPLPRLSFFCNKTWYRSVFYNQRPFWGLPGSLTFLLNHG